MHISISPIANDENQQPNLKLLSLPEQTLCYTWPHTRTSCGFSSFNKVPPHDKDGKSPATQNRAGAEAQDTDKTHTAVMSTCWGGQPFPLACYSADQGQAGDQIKVLVWGELGPGAREAAWGLCAHTDPRGGSVGGAAAGQGQKEELHQKRPRASRLLGGCGKM